jgi:hypothetical protein
MINYQLPDMIIQGEPARLIPVVKDSNKEQKALSVLLAALCTIDGLAGQLFTPLGVSITKRTRISCYTEVGFKNSDDRPDGLIIIEIGKRKWTALVEAKIDRAEIDPDQIERYIKIARENKIDAVLTVSNQFVALPTHHPIRINKSLLRSTKLFHWSWMGALTKAVLLLNTEGVVDPEQKYILGELIRYLSHTSSGVRQFDQMNTEWKSLVDSVKSDSPLRVSEGNIINSVASWHQELRDICLNLTRRLDTTATIKLPNSHRDCPDVRLKDDSKILVQEKILTANIDVPNVAGVIKLKADVRRRSISCSINVMAPKDKKTAKGRVNWLLRQLAKSNPDQVHVKANLPRRSVDCQSPLTTLRENPESIFPENKIIAPVSFEVLMVHDIAGRFGGRKTFIESIEALILAFFEEVAEHIKPWMPKPPQIKERSMPLSEEAKKKTLLSHLF